MPCCHSAWLAVKHQDFPILSPCLCVKPSACAGNSNVNEKRRRHGNSAHGGNGGTGGNNNGNNANGGSGNSGDNSGNGGVATGNNGNGGNGGNAVGGELLTQ